MNKKAMQVLSGPIAMVITSFALSSLLTPTGAQAVGILIWTILWWGLRPVNIAITAMIPLIVNAILSIVPMSTMTSQFVSTSIILIFGSGMLTIPWGKIGLDRRIALGVLSAIGPSMKLQIVVWLLVSIMFSTVLPNVVVCALLTPIAAAMLKAVGYEDIPKAAPAVPILLCIGWGAGLGGVGTPLGGAMNLVAINLLQEHIGVEFMYIDWIVRILPYFVIGTIGLLAFMLAMPLEVKSLEGSKEYFSDSYKELGPMKQEEKISALLFVLAIIGAFTRSLYAELLPALEPAYLFLILGSLSFFVTYKSSDNEKVTLLTWDDVQKNTMWGMLVLFGGGLSLGTLINGSGASDAIARIVTDMNMDGGFTTLLIFAIASRLIGELINSTASAAIIIPIALQFCLGLGLNPIPYWFVIIMAYNSEYVLPISVRAIPVAYGLDANIMFKRGLVKTIISVLLITVVGYVCLEFWPSFSILSNYSF